MPLFFLGTREWRNRQTRTVQVRVPVMEWGFNSPLAHDETADPSGSAVFVFPGCGDGVAAPVFWVIGHYVLLVAPRVFRAPSGAGLRRGRRPARVMVLLVAPLVFRAPEGPAAREARASLRSAPRLEARPCPPVPPAPSTPVGPGCFVCLWASSGSRVLSFWGARVRVVTNVVNPRAFSLKMAVFGLGLTTFVTGVLTR